MYYNVVDHPKYLILRLNMPLSSLFLVRETALLKFLKSLIYTVVLDTIYENNIP